MGLIFESCTPIRSGIIFCKINCLVKDKEKKLIINKLDKLNNSKAFITSVVPYFLLFALVAFPAPTYAEFINTYTDGRQSAWIDTSSKEGSGNIRRIMELVNYKNRQVPKPGFEYLSIIYQYQFDCNKRAFKVLMSVAYEKHQGRGRVVFRDDTPTPSYAGVRDGSSIYEALVIACK